MSESTVAQRLCPHPEYDTVVCPACRSEIRGLTPAGSSEDPAARCPACESAIDSIIPPR